MLDTLFNDKFSIRRLTGHRDGHGKPTYATVVEQDSEGDDTDVPVFVDCFLDRRRTLGRGLTESTKSVDATLQYNITDSEIRLKDTDLLVMDSTGETYRIENIREQVSNVEGSEYALVALGRVKTAVSPNSTSSDNT